MKFSHIQIYIARMLIMFNFPIKVDNLSENYLKIGVLNLYLGYNDNGGMMIIRL